MRRFVPGEAIVLREMLRGRIWAVRPLTVVRDAEDLSMFYLPPGTRWYGPVSSDERLIHLKAPGADWSLGARRWSDAHVLSFSWPDAGAAVLHFWDEDWTPSCWYVNVEAPLRRFALGFDTFDHDLDVVVQPDRSSWRWKDEDDVAEGIRLGVYTEQDEAAFRREGERGLERILGREPPFDRDWSRWRPEPSWPSPTLPPGWDRVLDG
jgi:hypothetical protein